MPVVQSRFVPRPWLRHGHLQTVLPVLLPRRLRIAFVRERVELPDGDFLDLDWANVGAPRVAILSHGLEGCSAEGYIRGMAAALNAAGWDTLAWNFRGCGAEPNRLPRSYHSGETEDLRFVIGHAALRFETVALVGFSLGGNMMLKYLGEAPSNPAVRVAAAISAPVDVGASARELDVRWSNRLYLRRFLKSLIARVEAKALRFPGQLDVSDARRIRTFQEFDDRFTSRMHGFRDAADYWARSSARQYLSRITVPSLLLNARDDPFLSPESFPFDEAQRHPFFHLETPLSGGHTGFLDFAGGRWIRWAEGRVTEFFEENQHGTTAV